MKIIKSLAFVIMMFVGLYQSLDVKAENMTGGDDVYIIVEEMPVFPGGDEALRNYITNNIRFPNELAEACIQGRVYVCFVIDTTGKVTNVRVARPLHPSLDAEAIRVVKNMPKWKPGRHKGKVVKVSYTIPINFALK